MAVPWRKIVVAGLVGFACGRAIKYAKKHPERARYIVKCSACAGLAGLASGAAYGIYRGRPAYVYSLSLGANLSVLSVSFLGVREAANEGLRTTDLEWNESRREYVSSSASGGVTGLSIAAVARLAGLSGLSMYGAVTSVTSGALLGCAGQYVWNRCSRWRREKAISLHYPGLLEDDMLQTRRWSWDNFTRRFVEITHQQMPYNVLQEEISALEQVIAEERAAIESLNSSLNLETSDIATMSSGRIEHTPNSNVNPQTGSQTSS